MAQRKVKDEMAEMLQKFSQKYPKDEIKRALDFWSKHLDFLEQWKIPKKRKEMKKIGRPDMKNTIAFLMSRYYSEKNDLSAITFANKELIEFLENNIPKVLHYPKQKTKRKIGRTTFYSAKRIFLEKYRK